MNIGQGIRIMLGSVIYFLKLSFPCLRRGFGRQAVEGEEEKGGGMTMMSIGE
jgi:hypothetical protein